MGKQINVLQGSEFWRVFEHIMIRSYSEQPIWEIWGIQELEGNFKSEEYQDIHDLGNPVSPRAEKHQSVDKDRS